MSDMLAKLILVGIIAWSAGTALGNISCITLCKQAYELGRTISELKTRGSQQ
jgi:hypothetical protein